MPESDSLEGILQSVYNWGNYIGRSSAKGTIGKGEDESVRYEIDRAKTKIEALILDSFADGYRTGRLDMAKTADSQRSRLNASCPICGANPMTANCNQARCDK